MLFQAFLKSPRERVPWQMPVLWCSDTLPGVALALFAHGSFPSVYTMMKPSVPPSRHSVSETQTLEAMRPQCLPPALGAQLRTPPMAKAPGFHRS